MKKIVILGGGLNQLPLMQAAKSQGYQVALYDAKDDVPCKIYADEYHVVDISDSAKVIGTIKEFGADGVVCNTESLMPCLAEVQTSLGFIGNTRQSVENISNKYTFRSIQKNLGFFSPDITRTSNYSSARKYVDNKGSTQVIKPEKSSGSRGVFVIQHAGDFTQKLFDLASGCSRDGYVLIEDYIDFSSEKALEAEVFLSEGEVKHLGLFRTIRDKKKNLVPQCYCSSIGIDSKMQAEILRQLQVVFQGCGIQWGEYNVELTFTPEKKLFIIEINPRQGGMMLPSFVLHFSGVDMNRLLVTTSVGDNCYAQSIRHENTIVKDQMIHFRMLAEVEGIYHGYRIDDEISDFLVDEFLYYKPNDTVHLGETGYSSIGTLDFDFSSLEKTKYREIEKTIYDYIHIEIE